MNKLFLGGFAFMAFCAQELKVGNVCFATSMLHRNNVVNLISYNVDSFFIVFLAKTRSPVYYLLANLSPDRFLVYANYSIFRALVSLPILMLVLLAIALVLN